MRLAFLVAAALFVTSARAELPGLRMLDGGDVPRAGRGALVLMFWRPDCPPCLVELRNAEAYVKAAGSGGRVLFVGLQDPALLRRGAARFSVPAGAMAYVEGDPQTALAAYGGASSLPSTVILAPSGRRCFRQAGLLGTDALEAGLRSCGGGDAGD